MTSSGPGDDVTLDDIVARVRELPTRFRSLYVETERHTDDGWAGVASNRSHGVLVHGPDPSTQPERRSSMRSRSWMEFGDDAWGHKIVGVQPARWRNESEFRWSDGSVERVVSGRDGDVAWSGDGDVAEVTTAGIGSLRDWWVVNSLWVDAPVDRQLLDDSIDLFGRTCAEVRIRPQPGRQRVWAPGPFVRGGEHTLSIDVPTGATQAVTSALDGIAFERHEVVALEFDIEVDAKLTLPPEHARARPPRRTYRDAADLASEVSEFLLVAPTRLPPSYHFQLGDTLVERDGATRAFLSYTRNGRRPLSIWEDAASPQTREEVDGWTWVERGERSVLISDVTEDPGERLATVWVGGTHVFMWAALSAEELLDVAFSLQPVST